MNKRNWAWTLALSGVAALLVSACATEPKADYPVRPVSFSDVRFIDGFWAKRQETNRTVTIPHNFKECEETGRIKNFEVAGGAAPGKFCTKYAFDDSDVYKVIEAAAYSLALHPDAKLETSVDGLAVKIAAAQEPDGYLYTARTIDPKNPPRMSGLERWANLADSHELYVLGHFYEAAAAYHAATGKRNLLDIALKSADFVAKTFGPGEKQLKLVPGHEEIEIGLVKLYRASGKKKYLDLAKFFIDERGNASGHKLYGEYAQDHKPVLEQTEAVGHAVRAAYLFSGMADIAALTGDKRYMDALDKLWEDVVTKKLYLTGGIGAAGDIEGFGPAYDLPNATGYAETCATIAYALWNWRMSLFHADAKYMDLFERAAYNAFLSGAGMSGDLFFYPNPLASDGRHQRTPWFDCACCPPNVARFIAELGGFAYGVEGDKVYVNLYGQGTANIKTKVGKVAFEQTTDYPWTGDIAIGVAPEKPVDLTLMVRVPGWSMGKPLPGDLYRYAGEMKRQPVIKVNGEIVAVNVERGYMPVTRTWEKGDTVEISLPMEARRVFANDNIKSDAGLVAVERGPLVYCAESVDNSGPVAGLVLEDGIVLVAEARPDLLNGLIVITAEAHPHMLDLVNGIDVVMADGRIPRSKKGKPFVENENQIITLIPYYAWAHRGPGEMAVWLSRRSDAMATRRD